MKTHQAMEVLKKDLGTEQGFLNLIPSEMKESFTHGLSLHKAQKAEIIAKAEQEKAEAVEAEKEKARQKELDRIAVENIEKAVKEKSLVNRKIG